ncbi:MAG TPA: sulfatase-like hydrolase/transferase, partial [Terriglobales bacterium]
MFRRNVTAALALIALAWPFLCHAASRPNIVLITMESVRADRMHFLGAKTALTPELDSVAGKSLVFENAFAQSPSTVSSDATLLSGTYPQTHQVGESGTPLPAALPFLPDLLRAQGYRTAAFVSSIALDPRNGTAPGFDRGFSTYGASFHLPGTGRSGSIKRRGAEVAARAASWLAGSSRQPFFLWLSLADADGEQGNSYNPAVAAVDAAVGKLVTELRNRKLFDSTLIVIAAGHGESLGAHGEEGHGVFLYDETIHVPLLLKLPHSQSLAKHVKLRVSLVDVAPTILEIAGFAIPPQMQGRSLLRAAKGNPTDQPSYARSDFASRAFGLSLIESWRAGKYLYIRAPKPELYDLAADPGATRNLAQTSKATLETMTSQLEAFDRHFTGQGGQATLSSSEIQKLASLGYVGLQKPAAANAASSGTDPKDEISQVNRVLAAQDLWSRGAAEKAVALLQPVMASASNSYLAQFVMGAALSGHKQFAAAIPFLRRAIELQPDSTSAHFEMGSALLNSGDAKTAVVHLEIVAHRMPEMAE